MAEIQRGRHGSREHYYLMLSRLDLRSEQKAIKKQKLTKRFWVAVVSRDEEHKFVLSLEAQVLRLKDEVKFIRFYFKENDWQFSCNQLLELSDSKAIIEVCNIRSNKNGEIDKIIEFVSLNTKSQEPNMCKIIFIVNSTF